MWNEPSHSYQQQSNIIGKAVDNLFDKKHSSLDVLRALQSIEPAEAKLGKEFHTIPDLLGTTQRYFALKIYGSAFVFINLVFHRILDFKKGSISIDPFGLEKRDRSL